MSWPGQDRAAVLIAGPVRWARGLLDLLRHHRGRYSVVEPCHGIILVDKPAGLTSFATVERVRRSLLRALTGPRQNRPASAGRPRRGRRFKCGHAGSLDPLATGLLVVMCGQGTRLSPFLMKLDKVYRAILRFGIATDTLDAEGQILARRAVPPDPQPLLSQLPDFHGELAQVPPVFSAIKRNGQRLYKLARLGVEVPPLAPKPVFITGIEITPTRWGDPATAQEVAAADGRVYEAELRVHCSSGTYVRSLARDLAAGIGTLGYVHALRRLRIGPFDLAAAVPAEKTEDGEALRGALRPLTEAMPHLASLQLTDTEAASLRSGGQPLPHWLARLDRSVGLPPDRARELSWGSGPAGQAGQQAYFLMKDPEGRLVAVGQVAGDGSRPRSAAVFPAAPQKGQGCA
jgi:tRNA pseudouridine55 synthase